MTSPFTLVGFNVPHNINRFEIQEIFAQYGTLYGTGLRFPGKKSDNRFFIDFSDKASALKAQKSLHGKAHSKTEHGYKFDLKFLGQIEIPSTQNIINLEQINSISDYSSSSGTDNPSEDTYAKSTQQESHKRPYTDTKHPSSHEPVNLKRIQIHHRTAKPNISSNITKTKSVQNTNLQTESKPKTKSTPRTIPKTSEQDQNKLKYSQNIIKLLSTNRSVESTIDTLEDSSNEKIELAKSLINQNIGGYKLNASAQYGSFMIPILPHLGPDGIPLLDPTL